MNNEEYYEFIKKIKGMLGIDLALYKEAQMKRRLTSLRDKRGFSTFNEYYEALRKDQKLLEEFIDRITINVSEFYRNPKRWEVLIKEVFPLLIHNSGNKKLKIWSAACSTGEEPYSIAIIAKEYFPQITVEIIATDIDENVLERAKVGRYLPDSLKELPEELQRKYFKQENGVCQLDKQIIRQVKFSKHNLLEDPYPRQVDLIICRNVLIYFTDLAKDKIYNGFSHALVPGGVLFVGSTEQIFTPNKFNLRLLETFFYQKEAK